jgi:hypothetical protein
VADSATPIDQLVRVTIVTDGGRGGRGETLCTVMTPEDAASLIKEAKAKRQI